MAAQSVDTFVLAFSDPDLPNTSTQERARINSPLSYESYVENDHIRTLSTNSASDGDGIGGFLYVPDLEPSDPCVTISSQYIPKNVTRRASLPHEEFTYIAFAPWISAPCTQSYLDAISPETIAFLTYLPNNETTKPPSVSNETWDLHDGGRWKSQHKFPVYAIPGADGATIMQQLGRYTGNSTTSNLIREIVFQSQLDPKDYVRLFTTFSIGGSTQLPSLWAFLLIVLGLILILIGSLSFTMHWVQRRRRQDLRRRIDNGEVDLETLGIKRAPIPQEAIDSLPTSIYTPPIDIPKNDSSTNDPAEASTNPIIPTPTSSSHNNFSQPTCPICLDDFIPHTTTIRSLPCHHIYHPECIDPFLLNNSSLCPICKARVQFSNTSNRPAEPITNAMVRRERYMRRSTHPTAPRPPIPSENASNNRWTTQISRAGRRVFSAPSRPIAGRTTSQIEMGAVERRAVSGNESTPTNPTIGERPPADVNLRREWIRRRMSTLRGPGRSVDEEEAARRAAMSRWRRGLAVVFPGFR